MNSLKKYVPKRKYRERSQPDSRKRKGFLEKKQDYKIRADDYHNKEKKMKNLIEKARAKNPDEFYYQMTSSKMKDGENFYVSKEERSETIKKRIDYQQKYINLVNHKRNVISRLNDKLENEVPIIDYENKPFTHKIFVDSLDLVEKFEPKSFFESDVVDNVSNRIKTNQIKEFNFKKGMTETEIIENKKEKRRHVEKLIQNRENLDKLNKISSTLSYQKHLIGPGKKRKLEDAEGLYQYKFFSERKR